MYLEVKKLKISCKAGTMRLKHKKQIQLIFFDVKLQ